MKAWNRGINGVKFPDVCMHCKPPKRNQDCHASCPDYLKAKAEFDVEADAERAARKAHNDSVSVAFLMKKG